ncbi:hypothetical protein JTB14_031543 [Gonioctena quinquepunctata]|nr:hypothetical protein JTB14_031543 [Gonioctena quinquepunctata]
MQYPIVTEKVNKSCENIGSQYQLASKARRCHGFTAGKERVANMNEEKFRKSISFGENKRLLITKHATQPTLKAASCRSRYDELLHTMLYRVIVGK